MQVVLQNQPVPTLSAGVLQASGMIALPDFDAHSIEESLLVNHRIFEGSVITRDQLPELIAKYRAFWREHKAAGMPEIFKVPDRQIGRVWHTHMCETRQYAEDCAEYFGKYFHHSSRLCDGGAVPGDW